MGWGLSDVFEVNYSRFVGWIILVVYLPIIFLGVYAVTHPLDLKDELTNTDNALAWLLFSWMPTWLIFLLSVWVLGLCLVQFSIPLRFMRAKAINFRFDPAGLMLNTWPDRSRFFPWSDLKKIKFSDRGVALKLQVRTKTEQNLSLENILRRLFFAPIIPDVNGPALQERMNKVLDLSLIHI